MLLSHAFESSSFPERATAPPLRVRLIDMLQERQHSVSIARRENVQTGSLTRIRWIAGATVQVGVDPSKCVVTKLKMDNDRKQMLLRKGGAEKSKLTGTEVATMENID